MDLQQLENADTDTLMQALLSLRGVGPKVANCIMLFGYHRLECFPIDVWMSRVIEEHYGGVAPDFGAHAGVAQQYLFYWERLKNS
jgi:N-glycosylase/DNA lyase